MKRRTFLGTVGTATVVGVAGCQSSPDHESASDAWNIRRQEGEAERIEGTVTLDAGKFAVQNTSVDATTVVGIEFDVVQGGPADVLVMDRVEFESYREGEEYNAADSITAMNSMGDTLEGQISRGEYRLVVANTGMFSEYPEEQAVVEMTARIIQT